MSNKKKPMHINSNAFISAALCICIGLSTLTTETRAYSGSAFNSQKSPYPVALMSGIIMAVSNPDFLVPLAGLRAFYQNRWFFSAEDLPPPKCNHQCDTFDDRVMELANQYPDKDMVEILQMALEEKKQSLPYPEVELQSVHKNEDIETLESFDFFMPPSGQDSYSIKGIILIPHNNGSDSKEDENNDGQEDESEKDGQEEDNKPEDENHGNAEASALIIPDEVTSCYESYEITTNPETGVTYAHPKDLSADETEQITSAIELYQDQTQRRHLFSGSAGTVEYVTCHRRSFVFKRSYCIEDKSNKKLYENDLNRSARENRNELIMLTRLKHKHILRLLAVIPEPRADGRQSWILISRWMGNSLYQHLYDLPDRGRIVTNNGFMFAIDILSTVGFLHKNNIVHSDLNARNFVVHETRKNQYMLILLDFGVARTLDDEGRADAVGGTPLTIAPELRLEQQVKGVITRASDAFSAGVILGQLAMCDIATNKQVYFNGVFYPLYNFYCAFKKHELARHIAESWPDGYRCLDMCDSDVLPVKGQLEPDFFKARAIGIIQYIATMMTRLNPHERLTVEMGEYLLQEYRSYHLQLQPNKKPPKDSPQQSEDP